MSKQRYHARDDDYEGSDAWRAEMPEPHLDDFPDSADDWLWSRCVQDSRLPHEINDAAAREVLDQHEWAWMPRANEWRIMEVINDELWRAERDRRRANPIRPRVLTAPMVVALRRRVGNGETMTDVARRYNVSRSSVSRAVRGKTWADVQP